MADRIRDLLRNTKREQLLAPQNVTSATDVTSASALDTGLAYEEAIVLLNVGAITGNADNTIDAVVEDSDDGTTDWAEADSAIDGASFAQIGQSGQNGLYAIRIRGYRRYVRIKVTVAGTTPDVFVASEFIGVPKQVN